jgi:hypothetical protein
MQPYNPQALVAARIDEMRQEAETARQARDLKRARRRARRGQAPAQVRTPRTATPGGRTGRAGLPAS